MVKYLTLLLFCASFSAKSQTAQIPAQYMQKMWAARWISVSNTEGSKYGVYLFRKTFDWDSKAAAFPIYISADNRYKLYVNGQLVGTGPAKSDLFNWNFDIIDLKNHLKAGKNTIAVKIWNEAEFKPEFQISYQTGLIIQGGSPESQLINTDKSWKCLQDKSYEPITVNSYYALNVPSDTTKTFVKGYYVAGAGEKVTMEKHVKNWEKTDFDDKDWLNPQIISPGIPKNTIGLDGGNSWRLIPSVIPQMALNKQRFKKLVRAEGMTVSNNFPNENLQISANSKVILLLDQSELTNAYPTLLFSGGWFS